MRRVAGIVAMMMLCVLVCGAQDIDETMKDSAMNDYSVEGGIVAVADSVAVRVAKVGVRDVVKADSVEAVVKSDTVMGGAVVLKDTVVGKRKEVKDMSEPLYANFKPDPYKSMWLALAIPGAGQIYNRKYWKLPIVYGLGVGIGYAIAYTNRNYQDYRNAYQTYNSSQPNPDLYKPMIPEGYPESSYSNYFKTQMDNFRRSRDISIVAAVIAYALQVIDAFVDAQLSDFDVSPDLSIDVAPEVQTVNEQKAVGVGARVNF